VTLPVPDVDSALAELAYSQDQPKLSGVIPLSNYDGYYLGDPRFDELNRRKPVVLVHPLSPPGQDQSHLGLPEAMLDVCFETTRTAFSLIVYGVTERYPFMRRTPVRRLIASADQGADQLVWLASSRPGADWASG